MVKKGKNKNQNINKKPNNSQHLQKWCWGDRASTGRGTHLGPSIINQQQSQLQTDQSLNVKPETSKLLQDKTGRAHKMQGNRHSFAQALRLTNGTA